MKCMGNGFERPSFANVCIVLQKGEPNSVHSWSRMEVAWGDEEGWHATGVNNTRVRQLDVS